MRAKASESLTSVTGLGRKQKKPPSLVAGAFFSQSRPASWLFPRLPLQAPCFIHQSTAESFRIPPFFWKQYKLCCSTSGLETNSLSVNISRGRLGNKKEGWGLRCINRQRTSPAFLRGLSGSDHSVAMKPRTGTAVVLPLVLEIQQLSSLGYAILYL